MPTDAKKRRRLQEPGAMTWIIIITLAIFIIANLPLLYGLTFVHGGLISRLWGFAPNQFLFPLLFLPFATLLGLYSLRRWIQQVDVLPLLPPSMSLAIRSWPVLILGGIAISSLICIVIYLASSWSFDKLESPYASRAVECASQFELEVAQSSSSEEERNQFRENAIQEARSILKQSDIPHYGSPDETRRWVSRLNCAEYLQVSQSARLQKSLGLLHPAMHVLAVIQLFVILSSAFITVSVATFAAITEMYLRSIDKPGHLETVISPIQASIVLYAMFALCYSQHRREVDTLIGGDSTVLQDIFVAALALALLSLLSYLRPSLGGSALGFLAKYFPSLVLTAGAAGSILSAKLLRRLIGSQTNAGIQALIFIVGGLCLTVWTITLISHN